MGPFRRTYDLSEGPPPPDPALARFAAQQHGIAALTHLHAAGLTMTQIRSRVAAGRLHRLYPGVYAVGHTALTLKARWLAAVWACGPNAVLSHRDAAALHGFGVTNRRLIEVTTPDRGRKGHDGIDLHRVRTLDPADVAVVDAIPTTTVARTLVDLAGVVRDDALKKAVHEADLAGLLDVRAVDHAIARARGRRGTKRLQALVDVPAPPTKSELERRFIELVRAASLPMPLVNTLVATGEGDIEVDCLWKTRRLVVELDGAKPHRSRYRFEDDRRKHVALTVAGYTVVRFTWRRITEHPGRVTADLRALLAR